MGRPRGSRSTSFIGGADAGIPSSPRACCAAAPSLRAALVGAARMRRGCHPCLLSSCLLTPFRSSHKSRKPPMPKAMTIDHCILTRFGGVFKHSNSQFEDHRAKVSMAADLGHGPPQSAAFRAPLEAPDRPVITLAFEANAYASAAARRRYERQPDRAKNMSKWYHLEPWGLRPLLFRHAATFAYATSMPHYPSTTD